jgi:hypothetical protein
MGEGRGDVFVFVEDFVEGYNFLLIIRYFTNVSLDELRFLL